MRGIIFIGGEIPGSDVLRKIAVGADFLIAADSGLIAMEDAGLRPDWIVGDMDSLGSVASRDDPLRLEKYPPDRVHRYPRDKDFTDTELALVLLKEKGCDEIWIAGGGGGRLDHLFAVRALFEREEGPDRWYPGNAASGGSGASYGSCEIRCLKEGRFLEALLPPESIVSVFPLGKEGWEAESSGLKWPLNGLAWKAGSFGVSNVAQEGPIKIKSIRGRFMVIIPLILSGR